MSDRTPKPIRLELEDGTIVMVEARSLGGEEDVGIGDALKFDQVTKVVGGIAIVAEPWDLFIAKIPGFIAQIPGFSYKHLI